jgi:hypothetical protein
MVARFVGDWEAEVLLSSTTGAASKIPSRIGCALAVINCHVCILCAPAGMVVNRL